MRIAWDNSTSWGGEDYSAALTFENKIQVPAWKSLIDSIYHEMRLSFLKLLIGG